MSYLDCLPQDILHIILSKLSDVSGVASPGIITTEVIYSLVFQFKFPMLYNQVKDIIDDHFTMYATNVDITTYNKRNILEPDSVITLNVDKWLCVLYELSLWYTPQPGVRKFSSDILDRLHFYQFDTKLYKLVVKDKYHEVNHVDKHFNTFISPAFMATVKGYFIDFDQLRPDLSSSNISTLYYFMTLDNWMEIIAYILNNYQVKGGVSLGLMTDRTSNDKLLRYLVKSKPSILRNVIMLPLVYGNDNEDLFNYILDHNDEIGNNLIQSLDLILYDTTKRTPAKLSMISTLKQRLGL